LCVTGGPGRRSSRLRSPKRAIVAGPGNPPVVVDETADLENAANRSSSGGGYDNNLLCIGENGGLRRRLHLDEADERDDALQRE